MRMDWPSAERHAEQLPLTRAAMDWFIAHYLRSDADEADWRASPLRASSLKGLPPALIITAGFDPLCDEGEAYAKALRAAGVAVVHERFDGADPRLSHDGAHRGGFRPGHRARRCRAQAVVRRA